MHRYSNGGLVDNDEGLTTDPDFIEDALKQVTMYTRSHYDGIWQYLLEKDPAEGRARLLHQRVYVAKYMGESVFSWDDRETTELQDYYEEVNRMVRAENERQARD